MFAITGSSCTTYYDAYGYSHQSVDPGVAVAGAVAAGALGYALADSHNHRHYRRPDSYYRGYSHPQRRYYYDRRGRSYCY